ncbi:MAG: hypothetical protein J2P17_00800 [Mycobacterium sp.]|nr:hypothetical protein [Mycobacterium sp.]
MTSTLKLGRKPSAEAPRLKLSDYVDVQAVLPKIPPVFGHQSTVSQWGMYGNDQYGDCVWAGAGHEHLLWNAANNRTIAFTDDNILSAYSAVTGFNPDDPSTDQGTDMLTAAKYRQQTGLTDAAGNMHKIGAYLALKPGDINELAAASYLFGAVGIGIVVTDRAMEQFQNGQPWKPVWCAHVEGGHYVPVVGRNADGNFVAVTWGALQELTPKYYVKQSDEVIAYVSQDYLTADKSPEGFDQAALVADLGAIQTQL